MTAQTADSTPADRRPADRRARHMMLQFICTGVLAWLVLCVYRGVIVEPPEAAADFARTIPAGIAASFYDLVFIASLTGAALLLLALVRRSRPGRILVAVLFYLLVAVALAWGFANINLVKVLGEPFTFQWLVYGDFLQNADARNAMSDAFNLRDFSILTGAIVAVLVLGFAASRLWLSLGPVGHRIALGAIVLGVGVAAVGSGYHVEASALPANKLQNPVVHFVESALLSPTPVVLTMPANPNDPAVASVGERPPETSDFVAPDPNPVKNVLLYIMESVPAKYVESYGGKYPVTPNIKSVAGDSIRFNKIYAHAPSTNYTIFSLFTSLYNDISYYGMTGSHPYLRLDTLPNMLSRNGFRTGFFWSADSRFQRVDEFLLNKGFDTIEDFRGQTCDLPTYRLSTEDWKNADYNNDLCTADQTLAWINKDPDKPFFATMFTAMTHYPYQVAFTDQAANQAVPAGPMELVHYVDDEKFNSYLNALRIGDLAFGKVLDNLKQTGRLDSTLIVIMGDHGEAFGEHGTYSHASAIYDENVHIPLIMINRNLFHGQTDDRVGGIIDIAPTIFDILGLKMPEQWQGRSLFSRDRPDKTFFFAPWRGVQFGYREGDRKVMFNANTGKIEVYDLKADPGETKNLFIDGTSDATAVLQPIADWVQSHRRYIAQVIAGGEKAPFGCAIDSLVIEAGGTQYLAPPRFEVLVDGKQVTEVDAPAIPSRAATGAQSVAEMKLAATSTQPITINLPPQTSPQAIEIRFVNDLWGTPDNPGDRNLFIKSVKVNGLPVPSSRLSADEDSHGYTDENGTAIYENGSLWVSGPFVAGCK
jgi:lipoteichoic acid synthase